MSTSPKWQRSFFRYSVLCTSRRFLKLAEKVGFEPTEHCCSTVFKTASLNHWDTFSNLMKTRRADSRMHNREYHKPAVLSTCLPRRAAKKPQPAQRARAYRTIQATYGVCGAGAGFATRRAGRALGEAVRAACAAGAPVQRHRLPAEGVQV